MRFWDSSALVPLLFRQRTSGQLERLYRQDAVMAVWWLSDVECVSAIARLEREGGVPSPDASETALRRLAVLRRSWQEIQPTEPVRETARRLLRVHPLRAADSLQLAAAFLTAEGRPATLEFISLDDRLANAARLEGFVCRP